MGGSRGGSCDRWGGPPMFSSVADLCLHILIELFLLRIIRVGIVNIEHPIVYHGYGNT